MIFLFIFLQLYLSDAKIIKNINVPSCRNCIYYKQESLFGSYPELNKCEYFGEKNIQTDIIEHDFADVCRSRENKCGLEGKYFEQESNVELKHFLYNIKKDNIFKVFLFIILLCIGYLKL